MDDDSFSGLETALAQSPDNLPLRLAVARAALARDDPDRAAALVESLTPTAVSAPADRLLVAKIQAEAGDVAQGLAWLEGLSDAAAQLLRAYLLLQDGRLEEAAADYRAAVAENPALEDRELEQRLNRRVVDFPAGGSGARAVASPPDRADEGGAGGSSGDVVAFIAPAQERVTFADVGGLEDIKKQIRRRIITPFEKPSLFAKFRKKAGGGILLYGPPGVGKTLLARATAGECNAEFFNIEISDVLDMWQGESERKLHALFEAARQHKPAVLFFDELEALGGKRRGQNEGGMAHLVSQFLAEMDGFSQNNDGVLVMGASNVPWAIDPAFRRPGRFDRVLFVPPPDKVARGAILDLLLRGRPLAETVKTAKLVERTSSFSGADLENLVETAVDLAIEESLEGDEVAGLTNAMLFDALKEVKPTTLEWLTSARNYARYANEAGQYDDVLEFLKKYGR